MSKSLLETLVRRSTPGAVRLTREDLQKLLHRVLGSDADKITIDRMVLVGLLEEISHYRDFVSSAGDVGRELLTRAFGKPAAPVSKTVEKISLTAIKKIKRGQ